MAFAKLILVKRRNVSVQLNLCGLNATAPERCNDRNVKKWKKFHSRKKTEETVQLDKVNIKARPEGVLKTYLIKMLLTVREEAIAEN